MRCGSGTPLILAGRNALTLAALAAHLGVEYRVFALDDAVAIDRSLGDVGALLNCAGPFVVTADVLMNAANPRITIDGDTARLDALVEAQHVSRDDPAQPDPEMPEIRRCPDVEDTLNSETPKKTGATWAPVS